MDLEQARDDLMFEVHKLKSDRREYDKNVRDLSPLHSRIASFRVLASEDLLQ